MPNRFSRICTIPLSRCTMKSSPTSTQLICADSPTARNMALARFNARCLPPQAAKPSCEIARPKFVQRPGVFVRQLVDDVAIFHRAWKNLPRVRLHFDVVTETWIFGQEIDHAENLVRCGVEQLGRPAVQRNVKMN